MLDIRLIAGAGCNTSLSVARHRRMECSVRGKKTSDAFDIAFDISSQTELPPRAPIGSEETRGATAAAKRTKANIREFAEVRGSD